MGYCVDGEEKKSNTFSIQAVTMWNKSRSMNTLSDCTMSIIMAELLPPHFEVNWRTFSFLAGPWYRAIITLSSATNANTQCNRKPRHKVSMKNCKHLQVVSAGQGLPLHQPGGCQAELYVRSSWSSPTPLKCLQKPYLFFKMWFDSLILTCSQ